MLLDLEDKELRVRLTGLTGGRMRLVIDYPADPRYRESVFGALAELLRTPLVRTPKEGGVPCR